MSSMFQVSRRGWASSPSVDYFLVISKHLKVFGLYFESI